MGKVLALIFIALGAIVHAEEVVLVDSLVDRASNQVVGEILVDMDDATLAKPAKAKAAPATRGAAKKAPPARRTTSGTKRGARDPIPGTFTPFKKVDTTPKRLFGGTNRIEGNMAGKGMAIQEERSIPGYWGGGSQDKGLGFGWSVGAKKVNSDGGSIARAAPKFKAAGTFKAVQKAQAKQGRLFGGTNRIEGNMAGKGQAIQEAPATPSYWGGKKSDKGIGYGWFTKKKAMPEPQTVPFKAPQPPAPGIGGARPQAMMGSRPIATPR